MNESGYASDCYIYTYISIGATVMQETKSRLVESYRMQTYSTMIKYGRPEDRRSLVIFPIVN